jgi:hypothetical protein
VTFRCAACHSAFKTSLKATRDTPDAAGNTTSTSTTLTVPPAVAITTIEGGDNLINGTEGAGGIQVSGVAEIGWSR